jgi:hypothetical protein
MFARQRCERMLQVLRGSVLLPEWRGPIAAIGTVFP